MFPGGLPSHGKWQALDLLNSLKSTVEADAVKQQEAYQKYKDWCPHHPAPFQPFWILKSVTPVSF